MNSLDSKFRPIEYDLKPEYGGIPRPIVRDPDALYRAEHSCGKVVHVKGSFLNRRLPLRCKCSFLSLGGGWRYATEQASAALK